MQTTQQVNHFKSTIPWGDLKVARNKHPYLNSLFQRLSVNANTDLTVADFVTVLIKSTTRKNVRLPKFLNQSEIVSNGRYYEQIIHEEGCVPTRENSWHDFFNALIWLQFPKTKQLLNQLHVEQISQHGVHPRTLMRNQITHFDECGLVLVGTDPSARVIVDALRNHDWHQALFEKRDAWHQVIHPLVFGHANLEMLLDPFLSLTGKWLYIECEGINNLDNIDSLLTSHIQQNNLFSAKGQLKPLPLLGVPSWHPNQDLNFYAQTQYFRPLRNIPRSA